MIAATGSELFNTLPEVGGLSLSVGTLLLAYAVRMTRQVVVEGKEKEKEKECVYHSDMSFEVVKLTVVEWSLIFTLVSVGLFWAVNSYALGVGTMRAQQIERGLPTSPDVVVYSEKSLDITLPGVRESICSDSENVPDAAYRYRYDGLKFVLQAGGQYLLLPAAWTRETGVAVVLPRSEALRLRVRPFRRESECEVLTRKRRSSRCLGVRPATPVSNVTVFQAVIRCMPFGRTVGPGVRPCPSRRKR